MPHQSQTLLQTSLWMGNNVWLWYSIVLPP